MEIETKCVICDCIVGLLEMMQLKRDKFVRKIKN